MSVLFTDDFESYAVRSVGSDAPLGTTWECYQVGIEVGTGHGGSKAAVSYQGALSHGGVNVPLSIRWGRTVVWTYRLSVAELAARGRDSGFYRGLIMQVAAIDEVASNQSGFGVMNDPLGTQGWTAGFPNSMWLWMNWRAADGSNAHLYVHSPACVVDSTWQKFDWRWKLSTVKPTSPFLNANGCAQLYVDDTLVLDQHDLFITLRDNTGPTVLNQWTGCAYALGGFLDDVAISNETNLLCPDTGSAIITLAPVTVVARAITPSVVGPSQPASSPTLGTCCESPNTPTEPQSPEPGDTPPAEGWTPYCTPGSGTLPTAAAAVVPSMTGVRDARHFVSIDFQVFE
jgi:hypothetical protein